jgi:hypothetical protein
MSVSWVSYQLFEIVSHNQKKLKQGPFYCLNKTANVTNIRFQKEMNQKEGNNLGFEFLCSINREDYFYGQLAG